MAHIRRAPDVLPRAPAAKPARDATPSARERLGLAALTLGRVRRRAVAGLRRSRLLRWRYRAAEPDELLISPTTLRTQDPSFANEVALGSFGLAGAIAHCGARSPFQVAPPTPAWARELHGFAWLRHLEAAATQEAGAAARRLVGDWLRHGRNRKPPAWAPDGAGRRLISWLTHAWFLLEATSARQHSAFMRSLADQRTYLAASWRNAPDGYPRLLALIALVQADLGIAGHDRQLAQSQDLLGTELDRQILADGGHFSRAPWVLVDLLTDLLPLRRCFAACAVAPDARITGAIQRMMAMLHALRLGDGALARFNGMGASRRGELMTVLDYADGAHADLDSPPAACGPSGYVRLQRGGTVIVADAAPPPPLELAAHAHAGCLAFEMSAGRQLLLVNAGAPAAGDPALTVVARATASHNTLCLQDQSSAKLIRDARLERMLGSPPLRHPDAVTCTLSEAEGGVGLAASHDGYLDRFGLVHTRSILLAADGRRIVGRDGLTAPAGVLRFAWDLPFAIHFHLHPEVEAHMAPATDAVDLLLPDGECWRLAAIGAALSIEASQYLADPSGPSHSLQVALRGRSHGDSQVYWTITRIDADATAAAFASPSRGEGDASMA